MTTPDLLSTPIFSGMVRLDDIRVPTRLRDIKPAHVQLFEASISETGLKTRLILRPNNTPGESQKWLLVTGAHRYCAISNLGWEEVSVDGYDLTGEQALMVEIDENLVRHELNPLDKAIFIGHRKRLYEAMHPDTRHGGDRRSKRDEIKSQKMRLEILAPRFTADAAEKTGLSERTVQIAVQIASLDPEAIDNLRNAPVVPKQSQLVALTRETPVRQRALTAKFRTGEVDTVAAARVAAGFQEAAVENPQATYLAQLLTAWGKADVTTRKSFLTDIDAQYLKTPENTLRKSARTVQ